MKSVDKMDANIAIIVSDNFNNRRIFCKSYYKVNDEAEMIDVMANFMYYNPNLIKPNSRIDIYRVRYGKIIGGGI